MRQKLTGNQEQKKKKILKKFEDYKSEFTVDYCRTVFNVAQMEKGNSKYTINFYKQFFNKYEKFVREALKCGLADLSIEFIEQDGAQAVFMEWLKGQGLKTQTINAYLRGLRSFGNFCEEEGYLDAFKCPIKEVEPPVKQVYTDSELERLLIKPDITDFTNFRTFAIINLILNTGARSNTVLNIKLKDLELEEGYINFNTTKAHKVVRLGLDSKVKRVLKEWSEFWRYDKGAEADDYLFCNVYGEQMTRSTLDKSFSIYNRSRGVEKTSIHLLRHTFAKKWITSGGDIITLAKVLTHSELEMVKRYANLYGSDVKAEMEEHSAISQMKTKSGKTIKNRKIRLTDKQRKPSLKDASS